TAFLETLERGNREEIIESLVAAAPRGLTLAEIVARTGRHENEIQAAVKNLATAGRLRVAGGQPAIAVSSKRMEAWRAAAQKSLEEFHRANPLLPGIPQQDLRAKAKIPRAEVFAAVLEDLTKTGSVTVDGDLVRRAGREIALSPEESRAKELIEREFERAGLKAPGFAEVLEKLPVEAARARKILQILLREGVLVKIAEDLVLHRTASKGLRELVAGYRKQRGDRFNVAAFKELTGVTRKYAIPLLEYLDRERVTRRVGDVRVIL
ncbi:MAG TPA: SelB C-terminal domain-containing protein, partial [Candidatus Acidoferrales bacterium]